MPSFPSKQTEVDFSNRKRNDGLQRPWHVFQLLGWALYLFLGVTAFGFILPLVHCTWQSTVYSILGLLFFGHFVFHILTSSIDTSSVDPNVPVSSSEAKKIKTGKMHCYIIPITFYKEKTRFCYLCGKNVFNFDHHSQIFNTCVGGRNFWFYMNCLVTAFLGTTCLAIISLFVFSMYCYQPSVKIDMSNSLLVLFSKTTTQIQAVVILLISFTDGVLSILIASVLGHHICFHLYVLCRGLTTQEYYERLAQKKSVHQNPKRSRDLEAVHFSMLPVIRKSHLYLCNSATQTFMENANATTQTNTVRFKLKTENEKEARPSSSSLTSLVEMLQIPFKLSRKA